MMYRLLNVTLGEFVCFNSQLIGGKLIWEVEEGPSRYSIQELVDRWKNQPDHAMIYYNIHSPCSVGDFEWVVVEEET